jgi:hypothetical protein
MKKSADKSRLRVLRFLKGGPACVRKAAAVGKLLLEGDRRGTISAEAATLRRLASDGLIERGRDRVALSLAGLALTMRAQAGADAFQEQHRDVELATMETEAGRAAVALNHCESPLAQLMRRKTRENAALLTTAEFEAGERLRSDYTRGQIMPRLGANWEASVSSGRRNDGISELTDAALSARQRVEAAIEAVGPELSGVLIDVCCFLKGMETVEMERGWPVRSAKIVLKSALGVLARHYDPGAGKAMRRKHQTLHWGAEDYRPRIG